MLKDKRIPVINLFLILTTLIAFLQVGNHAFLSVDDSTYIVENSHIQNGITARGLYWALTTGHASNWHPLTWISHMLDIQFFGLNPQWHHLVNLLFHIANTLLLFFVLHRMTKAHWQSAFVAALFALHPLHVESVAWVAERKDVLSTFFWMLTLVAYDCYAKKPRLKNYMVVIAFFALGLMAKPMVVTLPFVLLLLDYWPLERFRKSESPREIRTEVNNPVPARKKKGKAGKQTPKVAVTVEKPAPHEFRWAMVRPLVLEKIPLFVLTILSCIATYIAQNRGGAVAPFEIYSLDVRLANALVSYVLYITKTVWPDNLAILYPHPGFLPFWQVLGAILFLAAVTYAVIRTAKRSPYLPVGWLWFTGTLVPVIGIVQVGSQAMADRYTYIPSIGLFIMAAWGIPEILKKRRYAKEVLAASSALCLLCLFILTSLQAGHWRDSFTLSDHALNVTENNYYMHVVRGNALYLQGDRAKAVEDFTKAIEIDPRDADAYNNRGIAYSSMNNYIPAIEDFNKAIEINPLKAQTYNNRGSAYMSMGNITRAIEDYDIAIKTDPNYPETYYNRAISYQTLGKYRQAIDDYDKLTEISDFNKAEALCNRGAAYSSSGDNMKAIEDYTRTIELNPGHAKAYFNRGVAYGTLGDQAKAIMNYDSAISINPEYSKAYFRRGMAYEILGNQSQAAEDIKAAARLGSEDARKLLKSRGINW